MSPLIECMEHVRAALAEQQEKRYEYDGLDWIEAERWLVTDAANVWALRHGFPTVTVAQVEAVEPRACGHIDYTKKLALYVAELVCAPSSFTKETTT